MVKHYLSTSSPVDLEGSLMFPSPSFMESNTPALPVSVAPAGGLFKSSIFFQISLYSFVIVDSLEVSLRLLDASPFKSATPSAASHSKAKVRIFSKKQQTHIFSFQKINSRRLAMAFPLRVFGYRQRTMRVLHRVFSCRHAVTAFPLQVFSCRQLATALLHGVERAAPGDDRILHGVEKCAPLDDEILHGVERCTSADNSFSTASLSLSPTCGEILHGVVEGA